MPLVVLVLVLQSTVAHVNVHTVLRDWGVLVGRPISVNTDGDDTTEEWLVSQLFTARKRVVAVRDGRLCPGEWFEAANDQWALEEIAGKHALTRFNWPTLDIMWLDTPVCH